MPQKFKMQPVRGTRDIFGKELQAFKEIVMKALDSAKLFNYKEISLPIFEFSEIFHRTLGETSDVISKETYTFLDRDKDSITLRPEFTASIVRSIISNGLTQTLPIKYFTYGPVFRHERPQKARYRQFSQINFENIGISETYSDVEIISLAVHIFKQLGLQNEVTLELSSIGDIISRNNYKIKLIDYLSNYESDLTEESKTRLKQNPLRILDTKNENEQKILLDAPQIYDCFTQDALKRFEEVKISLTNLNIEYKINPKLVRGLDYYTHTVFEFTTTKLGSQGTVLAGGRYDGLFELMGGMTIPAIGFAAGVERLSELIMSDLENKAHNLIFLIPLGEKALALCHTIAQKIRAQDITVDWVANSNIGKQMHKANKMGATHTLIFGDLEIKSDSFKLKNMVSGHEKNLPMSSLNNLISYLI